MYIVTNKKGDKSARLSHLEQGKLAEINIQHIKIQKMREIHLPTSEILEENIRLSGLQRDFDSLLKFKQF